MYYLTLLWVRSLNTLCLNWDFCLGQNEGIGRAVFLFGDSEDKPASKPIQAFGWIQFYGVAGLRSCFLAGSQQGAGFCLKFTLLPFSCFPHVGCSAP